MEINESPIHAEAYIHPSVKVGHFCIIEEGVEIDEGTVIRSYVELRKNTKIGKNCYIDSGVKMSGNCVIGDDVTVRYDAIIARGTEIGGKSYICPQVMFNNLDTAKSQIGGAKVGKNCFIGTNTTMQHGITVEDNATIGAKSFVNKNIKKGETWIGIPAKKI